MVSVSSSHLSLLKLTAVAAAVVIVAMTTSCHVTAGNQSRTATGSGLGGRGSEETVRRAYGGRDGDRLLTDIR